MSKRVAYRMECDNYVCSHCAHAHEYDCGVERHSMLTDCKLRYMVDVHGTYQCVDCLDYVNVA